MFFFIVLVAWIVGVVMSFSNGNRKLPLTILLLGLLDLVGIFVFRLGWIGISILAILAIVIHMANKLDMA